MYTICNRHPGVRAFRQPVTVHLGTQLPWGGLVAGQKGSVLRVYMIKQCSGVLGESYGILPDSWGIPGDPRGPGSERSMRTHVTP